MSGRISARQTDKLLNLIPSWYQLVYDRRLCTSSPSRRHQPLLILRLTASYLCHLHGRQTLRVKTLRRVRRDCGLAISLHCLARYSPRHKQIVCLKHTAEMRHSENIVERSACIYFVIYPGNSVVPLIRMCDRLSVGHEMPANFTRALVEHHITPYSTANSIAIPTAFAASGEQSAFESSYGGSQRRTYEFPVLVQRWYALQTTPLQVPGPDEVVQV